MTDLDYSILYWIQDNIVCDALTPIMKFFTVTGYGSLWTAVIILLLLFKKTRPIGVCAAIAIIAATACNHFLLKPLFVRPRPFVGVDISLLTSPPGGSSFPSGHATSSFAAATAIFLQDKRYGTAALIVAALVAFSRLYFFVHFPSDVLCGALAGIFWAIIVTLLFRYTKKKLSSTSGRP